MSAIRDRVLARPDLAKARSERDIFALADGLNNECVMTSFPARVTANFILGLRPQKEMVMQLLRDAVSGQDVSERAAALLSPEGAETTEMRLAPPMVTAQEVFSEMFNDDGSEKE